MIPRRRAHTTRSELRGVARACHEEGPHDEGVIGEWEGVCAAAVGVGHAAAVSSGRRGMTLILKHLGITAGHEVIVPAYTLKDLLGLIEGLGARPVPADIDPETLNVTTASVERRITDRTKAVLVLHAFGCPCEVESIVAMAESRGVPVVEDCAHSLGATVGGRATGSFGAAGFFSLETTKPVNTFGGGMVVSRDAALIDSIRAAAAGDRRDCGAVLKKVKATGTERMLFRTGLCFPMLYMLACPWCRKFANRMYRRMQHAPPPVRYLPIQARLGRDKLATLDERIAARQARADLYRSLLAPEIRIQRVPDRCRSTWYFLVAVLPGPAAPVRRKLLWRGIDAGIEDEIADNCAALLGDEDCPNVEDVFPRAIALPMYEDLPEDSIRKIARILNKVIS